MKFFCPECGPYDEDSECGCEEELKS